MRVLVLDFETTGRDPDKDRIIELGAILWDPIGKQKLLPPIQYFVWDKTYPVLSEEISKITHITQEMLEKDGQDPESTLLKLIKTVEQVDYVLAYNKDFDYTFFLNECARYGVIPPKTTWICGMVDIPYRIDKGRRKRLICHGHDHGLTVDPTLLHRALSDVELLIKILELYDWNEIESYFKVPSIKIKAETSYDQRQLAKDAGFSWDPEKKCWWKQIKQNELADLRKNLKFAITELIDSHDISLQ